MREEVKKSTTRATLSGGFVRERGGGVPEMDQKNLQTGALGAVNMETTH